MKNTTASIVGATLAVALWTGPLLTVALWTGPLLTVALGDEVVALWTGKIGGPLK
jgi:hypothetical protein